MTTTKTIHSFRTTVEAHAERDGQRIDFEQPLIVRYRVIPSERQTATYPGSDGDIDIDSVERDTAGDYWDSRVSKDYWDSLTDADWDRIIDEAREDFHGR